PARAVATKATRPRSDGSLTAKRLLPLRAPPRTKSDDAKTPGSSLEDRFQGARPGRSPGSRIVLLPAPSRPDGQWRSRVSSPITVTGSRRLSTAFPGPDGAPGARATR